MSVSFEVTYNSSHSAISFGPPGCRRGSFTNHFRSKEVFCLEILECYFTLVRENIEKTRRGDGSRRPRSHRHCCDKAQLLLRRSAGRLNRQATEDRRDISPERRAICS